MERLLCEPEDRLGFQAFYSGTGQNSMSMSLRRSGFVNTHRGRGSVDGAEYLKVCQTDVEPQDKDLTGNIVPGPPVV